MTAPRPIQKILVANRGEIAFRVMRTCREMGIRSVAVYSDADRMAVHVRAAYQAVRIGPEPSAESYLCIEAILDAARQTGADAIHPGFGFLSENPDFVRAVEDAGLIFIGPSAASMEAMGDKIEARRRMIAAGVPVVPGTSQPVQSDEQLLEEARAIGYPVMIKASAGGGGKGIRIVHDEDELLAAGRRAASEAQTAFGNGAIYLEKFLEQPRHIEVQVFGDSQGQVVHLGERECSIQRRHQKVIEERPSTIVDEQLRRAMGESAVLAARAIDYRGAGTIEFLVDRHRNPYMLEMNTRLQVEHPITELTCGVDLVRWQILVAQGEPLPMSQGELELRGHAIECRLYAEDADHGFLPATGRVARLEMPSGPGVRLDSGLYEGMEVGLHYDPMLAKISVLGADRAQAIARMQRALTEVTITGVTTNLPFLRRVLDSEPFLSGAYDTGTIESQPELFAPRVRERRERYVAMIAAVMAHVLRRRRGFVGRRDSALGDDHQGTGLGPAQGSSGWVDAFRPGAGR